jgi:hypothetical protein
MTAGIRVSTPGTPAKDGAASAYHETWSGEWRVRHWFAHFASFRTVLIGRTVLIRRTVFVHRSVFSPQ